MHLEIRHVLGTIVAFALAFTAACVSSAADPQDACTDLTALDLIDMRITAAERLPAGDAGQAR